MPRISQATRHKIAEQAVGLLLEKYPEPLTTRQVARELVRDKEFARSILEMLKSHGMVRNFGKKHDVAYARWLKWQLTDEAKSRIDSQ